jgi:hypothetical protein
VLSIARDTAKLESVKELTRVLNKKTIKDRLEEKEERKN